MYELIEHRRLDANAASITFSNIPQNYSDLVIRYSLRHTSVAVDPGGFYFNTDTGTNYSMRLLLGDGSNSGSFLNANYIAEYNNWSAILLVPSGATANTFGNIEVHIPNYASTTQHKSVSITGVNENNATGAFQFLSAGIWRSNSAINAITISGSTGQLAQFSSATLYGVNRRAGIGRAPLAMGGYMSYSNGYWVHTFPSSGSFIPFTNMDVEYLVVAGGGGGGATFAGGGGAGGYRTSVIGELSGRNSAAESRLSLTANTTYTVTVGAGGIGSSGTSLKGVSGNDSSFWNVTATGGGGGGSSLTRAGSNGGSGGGASRDGAGGTGTNNQGFDGATSIDRQAGTGGGGASQIGGQTDGTATGVNLRTAGKGGDGLISSITGTAIARAGGGGGGAGGNTTATSGGAGGLGGGGTGGLNDSPAATAGTANTGGGGGGGAGFQVDQPGAAGGSGIVIVRYRA